MRGTVFKTQTGEVTIHATHLEMLTKALLPLPEKYNGLTNVDMKYRLRHVDLIMNADVRETFARRAASCARSGPISTDTATWKWRRPFC